MAMKIKRDKAIEEREHLTLLDRKRKTYKKFEELNKASRAFTRKKTYIRYSFQR